MAAAAQPKSSKRLQKEFLKLQEAPLPYASVSLVGDNILQWIVKLQGPANSPFEGGTFQINMAFPDSYPIKPPQANFVTPVYHPSVSMKSNGQICADVFEKEWSPILTASNVIEKLYNILLHPTPDSPLDVEIGEVLATEPKKYNDTAKAWTKKHAM